VEDGTQPRPHTGSASLCSQRSRRTSLLAKRDDALDNDSHRIPGSQYFILAVRLSILFFVYQWSRYLCQFGVPDDCHSKEDSVEEMRDLHILFLQGTFLALITGVHWPDRFLYIFCFDRKKPLGAVFIVFTFGAAAVWGLLGMIPGLKTFSLTAGALSGWRLMFLLAYAAGALWLVLWHLWRAFKYNSWAGFVAYTGSRLSLLGFYATYVFVAAGDPHVHLHFHHYAVGFLMASLAEFNHPFSVLLLAIGTGIFVQGLAIYGAAPIISRR